MSATTKPPLKRHKPVRWYNPLLLVRTGLRAALSTGMGRIADMREVNLGVIQTDDVNLGSYDYSDADGIWLDYVADIGDGWEAAYSVAQNLAAETLPHEGETIPRGEILVFGGDAVYPDPTVQDYLERTIQPYRTAYGEVSPFKADLFALPGNHDWYDGLRAFSDIFYPAAREYDGDPDYSFGGWTPQQDRSYFALNLPGNWWLCAVDIQLDARLDAAQYDYFKGVATELIRPADKVLICIASPTWEDISKEASTNDKTLAAVTEIFEEAEADVKLVMGGNFHHYAHYHPEGDGPHLITAGGGGAFMHPTHKLQNNVDVHWRKGQREPYTLGAVSPSKRTSHKLSYGNLLFPFKNWEFAIVIGLLYMVMSWILEAGRQTDETSVRVFFKQMVEANLRLEDTVLNFITTVPKSPVFALVVMATFTILVLYNWCGHWLMSTLYGLVHSAAHFFMIAVAFHISAAISHGHAMTDMHPLISYPFFMMCMLSIGAILGGIVFGVFMIIALNIFGVLSNNAFSPLRIIDYKNFVRLHFSMSGTLTVYPFGIEKVGKDGTPAAAIEPAFEIS